MEKDDRLGCLSGQDRLALDFARKFQGMAISDADNATHNRVQRNAKVCTLFNEFQGCYLSGKDRLALDFARKFQR